jgi:type 1 glutamine amidotransferase
MVSRTLLVLSLVLGALSVLQAQPSSTAARRPALRVLVVTGGCCHDYPFQTQQLQLAVNAVADVTWTVVNEGGKGTRAEIPLYDQPNWARPYDVVVHNECFADTHDPAYLQKIVSGHEKGGTPAVVVHCAMHSYRASTSDAWRAFLGVTSRRHDHQSNYTVRRVVDGHPALRGFPAEWVTPKDELYVIEKLWPSAKALAVAKSEKDGLDHAAIWVNDHQGTRVFGTTFGHGNVTWEDPVFLKLIASGLLWASGRN